jgi:peptidoglycan/xylan/chitin deacetylase (PgdA/CDA1 family)
MFEWLGLFTILLMGLFFMYIPFPMLLRPLIRRLSLLKAKKNKKIHITFDDGPDPAATPAILDLLKKHGVRATFFILGEKAKKYPELIQRIINEGHELGEHGYRHFHPWKCSPYQCTKDFFKSNKVLGMITKKEITLFRPPYGKLNFITLLYVLFKKRRFYYWSIDPQDYGHTSPDEIVAYIKKRAVPGDVVLLHDGRVNAGSNAIVTVHTIRALLEEKII